MAVLIITKVRLLTCKVGKGSVLWPGGTVRCLPGPFGVVSLVNRIGFISFSRALWGPEGPPVLNFKRFRLKIDILGFKLFVSCTGWMAGPPFMSGPAGWPGNWVVRVHSCLSSGEWGFLL